MDTPTLTALRTRSALLTARYPTPAGDSTLTLLRDDSVAAVIGLTGRKIGAVTGVGPFGCPLEDVPAYAEPLVARVVTVFAERMAVTGDEDFTESTIEASHGGLASFSAAGGAGSYSESYFGPGTATERKALDADPEIAGLLWALATDCVRTGWERVWNPELAGIFGPARATEQTDWYPESTSHPYPYDVYGHDGMYGVPGPDGW